MSTSNDRGEDPLDPLRDGPADQDLPYPVIPEVPSAAPPPADPISGPPAAYPPPPVPYDPVRQAPAPGLSYAGGPRSADTTMPAISLVAGIISTVAFCCCPPIGSIAAIIALVTGILAVKQAQEHPEQSSARVMAIIGIVLGAIVVILSIVGLALYATGTMSSMRTW